MNRIILTGASSDVGLALIKKLNSDEEYKDSVIYCQYRSHVDELEKLKKELNNISLVTFKCDLGNEDEVNKWIESIGDITPTHIVHLAADKFGYKKIKDTDISAFKQTYAVNLFSIVNICTRFVPKMAKERQGRIVFMLTASTLGKPPKWMPDYVSSKCALEGYMKAIASEYGSKGVTANGVSPNMMETKYLNNIDPRIVEMTASASLMKRNISIEETVDGIHFLLSNKASYINGINLNLSGGDYM